MLGKRGYELLIIRARIDKLYTGKRTQALGQIVGLCHRLTGSFFQAGRTHCRQVEPGSECAKRLVGADIGAGLFTPDVLLSGLERQNERTVSPVVVGLADDPARQLAHELGRCRHKAKVRSAIAQAQAKRLSLTDCDIRPTLSRGCQQPYADGIHTHDIQGLCAVDQLTQGFGVLNLSKEVWLLDVERGNV